MTASQSIPPLGATSYYRALGDGCYQPTLHTQGAWSDQEQHMAPVAGLLAHAIEQHAPRADLQLCRISYEILGMIAAEPTRVQVRTIRPGRTIELVEATAAVAGRTVVRASAWRLSRQDTTAAAGGRRERLPDPAGLPTWDGTQRWAGGYIASLEGRQVPGAVPGRSQTWLRTDTVLIDGVESTPLARFVGLVDTANGVATRVDPHDWLFPNTDLGIHLFRTPERGWVGLDTTVTIGDDGVGLTSAVLHDSHGPVGMSQQILTVRPGRR